MIQSDKPSKKPLIYYYVIAMIVLMILNAVLFPSLLSRRVQEVGYSDFLKMVDEGKVKEVSLEEDAEQIVFIAVNDENNENIYKTGAFPDTGLRERLENAGVKFESVIPTQDSPLLNFIITWILPIALFSLVGQLLMKRLQKSGMMPGANAMSIGKSGAKIVAENETGVTFANVAGQDEAKEALVEIVDFLHEPKKYADIGAKLPTGALLVGPPGTGKTLLARAVAGEAKVRDLFQQANEKAPCIVFIDEIDTIGKKRDAGGYGGNDEREQTLNQLLTEMDGFDGKKGVVILAATNRPESLDPALLRPGRFDRRIPVQLPDLNGRIAILKVHAKDVHLDSNVDFSAIARATSGASGAELANIINEAALRAVRMGRSTVSQEDLEESVETVIAGYQRKNAVMNPEERRIVSYHEIGHALVAAKQTNSAPVTKITIIPRTSGALGYTMQVDEGEHFLMNQEEMENKIATLTGVDPHTHSVSGLTGGQAAEKLVFGRITTGASNDIEQATKLARGMVARYGMSEEFGMVALETTNNMYLGQDTSLACAQATAERIDRQVIALVKKGREKADAILKENEPKLHELAAYLLDKETITGEEFMRILNAPETR